MLLIVRLSVKVIEHVEENGILTDGDGKPDHGVTSLKAVEENTVRPADGKLEKLQLRDVLLPPQVLLHLRSERGQRVIRVHNHL